MEAAQGQFYSQINKMSFTSLTLSLVNMFGAHTRFSLKIVINSLNPCSNISFGKSKCQRTKWRKNGYHSNQGAAEVEGER